MKEDAGPRVRFSLRTKNMLLLGSLFALMIAALFLLSELEKEAEGRAAAGRKCGKKGS